MQPPQEGLPTFCPQQISVGRALYRSNKNMRYRHHWSKCLGLYEAVYTQHPGTDEAARALYQSARMLMRLHPYSGKKEDLDQAIDLCRRLSEGYGTHRLADDAQYMIGEIVYEHKKDLPQAYVEFLKVEVRFPAGDMRPAARKMLDRLALDLDKKGGREKGSAEKGDSGSTTGLGHRREALVNADLYEGGHRPWTTQRNTPTTSSRPTRDLHTPEGCTWILKRQGFQPRSTARSP